MTAPARVLYVTAAGERGGAEAMLTLVLRHLDRRRFEPAVLCLAEGVLTEELGRAGDCRVDVIPAGRFRDLRRGWGVVRRLWNLIRERDIALVHANGTRAHVYAGPAAWLAGVPSIYHVHDVIDRPWSRQGLVYLAAALTPAAATIAPSRYVGERLRNGGWRRTVEIVPNAVETPGPGAGEAAGRIRAESGWNPDCPLVVWCGRLQRWKGPHVFVEAAARIGAAAPAVRFLVIGGSPMGLDRGYEQQLHGLAGSKGLEGRLRFTGHQPDPGRFIEAADVLVHSSLRPEPFGLVILEAMIRGTAVIASNEGGPAEVVEDGVTGLLTPPGDPSALAEALGRLLRDAALRGRMAEAGRARAVREFNVSRTLGALEPIYDRLIGPGPSAVARPA